jgi:acetoin utilization deacetylase AcuC-like enzyme|tara:strand:+ start:2041 stop:2976 length:936 start_codon:yes stop_codon:yes gene_type:complete
VKKNQFTLFYDDIYSSGLDPTARFPVDRYKKLYERLKELDVEKRIKWERPRLARKEELLLVHEQSYIDRFLEQRLREDEIRRIGLRPWKSEIVERTLRLTGGALEGLQLVLEGSNLAGNMAGGTHHAFKGAGAGYCIFNDLAICARRALLNNEINKVIILDLDVHQGDGTAEIFEKEDRVHTVSLHGKNNFPFQKKTSDWDLEFENGVEDEEYLTELDRVLDDLESKPCDLIFFQSGVDALASDALGLLNLSREGLRERNRKVFEWRKRMKSPMLLFMGGGYAKPIELTVDAFCDLFLYAAEENHRLMGEV